MLTVKTPVTHYPPLDVTSLRQQFPSLHKMVHGRAAIYLDGPGGTQVPQNVIDAMMSYLLRDNSNQGGVFLNSLATDRVVGEARRAVADLLNARRPEEIVFGQNMTTLTFQMSRALARTWQAGDEIIVTRLDHNANIDPWLQAANDRDVTVRWWDVDPDTVTLHPADLAELLNENTRLVACSYASNAVGSITDVAQVIALAHSVGALTYIDAVHYAPHGPIDVQALDCDFLVSSPYKYFGPHMGVLYGKYHLLDELAAYKVRPASDHPAGKWETGTPSFEGMAGVTAAVEYLAMLGDISLSSSVYEPWRDLTGRRLQLRRTMTIVKEYELGLSEQFLAGVAEIPGVEVLGVTALERVAERTPTFGVRFHGRASDVVARSLARQGIFVWAGNFYAQNLMERLGLQESGGVVRIGFVHYNTAEEIERLLTALRQLA
jgi:cysteine desulfurase family protein (TIGR01976 family)